MGSSVRGKNSVMAGTSGLELRKIRPKTENQERAFIDYEDGFNLILHGWAGTGKAQPLDCKIKIPNGWKAMGEISVGDEIICPDGSISIINGVFPQGKKDVWEIVFQDGRKTKSTEDHLWKITSLSRMSKRINGKRQTLYDIDCVVPLSSLLKYKSIKKRRIGIPLINSEIKENVELPIKPYTLGILLGDGCLVSGTAKFSTSDYQVISNIEKDGYITNKYSSKYEYSIHNLSDSIKKLSLDVKSENKHIPEIYLNSSTEQKMELLQGLMDSDGTVDKNSSVSFSSSSIKLINDVRKLIWSLGGTATFSTKKTSYNKNGTKKECLPHYRTTIRLSNIGEIFKLNRKKEKISNNHQYKDSNLKIVAINYLGKEECQCISIDHPEKLYITDDYIVTHNTFIATYLAMKEIHDNPKKYSKVIIVRSSVPSRDMGFLPGSIQEKAAAYEEPYENIFTNLYGRGDAYGILKRRGMVEFRTTSYMRGLTYDNAIILVDEIQNMTYHELDSIITRLGDTSKIIFAGDFRQTDLTKDKEKDGLRHFLKILNDIDDFSHVEFGINDIVRSDIVKKYIIAKENQKGY